MAFEYSMTIPGVVGEAPSGQIRLVSASWGHGRRIDGGTGAPFVKVVPKLVVIAKRLDRASGPIGELAVKRTLLKPAITGATMGTIVRVFLTLELEGALLESVGSSVSSGGVLT